jgi:hypothetical protein
MGLWLAANGSSRDVHTNSAHYIGTKEGPEASWSTSARKLMAAAPSAPGSQAFPLVSQELGRSIATHRREADCNIGHPNQQLTISSYHALP